MLSKEEILAAKDRASEIVDVPEWGGEVRVMELGATDMETLIPFFGAGDMKGIRALIASLGIVDDEGNRMFEASDLEGKSSAALDRIYQVVSKLSGLGEDLEKNSEATPADGSSTD